MTKFIEQRYKIQISVYEFSIKSNSHRDWNTQPPTAHCAPLLEADVHGIPSKQQRLYVIRVREARGTQGLKGLVLDTLTPISGSKDNSA